VTGTLENAGGQMAYLQEMTSRDLIPLDSCRVDTSGAFHLKASSPETRFFAVHVYKGEYVYLLARNGDHIVITGKAPDLSDTYTVEGSEESRLIRKLTAEQNLTIERIRHLNRIFNDSLQHPDFLRIKEGLDSAFRQIVDAQRKYTFRFIEENLHSQASLMALYQQIGPRQYILDPEKDFRYFAMVDSSLSILFPGSDAVKDLHRQVEELRKKQMMDEMSASLLQIGAVAPEIALPSPSGDTVVLSSLRGKIVLLDFWAAWCPPCRRENPNLVRNYRKYRDKGFEIYQVSLDQTRSAWLKGIEDDGLGDWYHVSDLKYWNSIVVPIYNIQGIPTSYLLDREGKIMDHNLRGEQLSMKLEEIFHP
jgi:thiol-disulfide isomerase/thioredoxin